MKKQKIIFKVIMLSGFLFVATLHVAAQKVTLAYKDVPLEKVLNAIKQQTGLALVFSDQVVDVNRIVSVNVTAVDVKDALPQVLKGTNVAFEIKNNKLYLIEKQETKNAGSGDTTPKKITGKVMDEKGEPLPGATIRVKSTNKGTITDMDGNFTIEAPANAPLEVSFVGYDKKIINAKGGAAMNISLNPTTLKEVVVVGYDTQQRGKVTSAIASVKIDKIDQGAGYDPAKMLEGRVTGVNVSSQNGIPGSTPNVLIRGVSSINGSSQPLYVVDGVVCASGYPDLNPNDIATMDVLKDASSAAIYGSRATNGVIIITTKQGKEGKTNVEISGRYGNGTVAHDIKAANTSQYVDFVTESIDNYNAQQSKLNPTFTPFKLYIPGTLSNTSWVKTVQNPSASNYALNISAAGGSKTTDFYGSFAAVSQDGILKTSDYKRYNARLNLNHKMGDLFMLHVSIGGSYAPQRLLDESNATLKPLYYTRELEPWYAPYNADGSYTTTTGSLARYNTAAIVNEQKYTKDTYGLIPTISLDFTPFKGFKYTTSLNAYGYYIFTHQFYTDKWVKTSTYQASQDQTTSSLRYVFDNIVSYENSINKLKYKGLLGHSFEHYNKTNVGIKSDYYAPTGSYPTSAIDNPTAGALVMAGTVDFTERAMESYFGRLTFDYDNRYLLNVSLRTDGSSKFSTGKKYGIFPAVSFGWSAMQESFLKDTKLATVLTGLKLRFSYGVTGNDETAGNYDNILQFSPSGNAYNGVGGWKLGKVSNIGWETAYQMDGGFDADLWNGRVQIVADYFYKKIANMLLNTQVPATSGYTTKLGNVGAMANQGLELSANAKILTGDFKWEVGANFSCLRDKILSLDPSMLSPHYNAPGDVKNMYIIPPDNGSNSNSILAGYYGIHAYIIGEPVSSYYVVKQLGIYQNDSDVPAALYAKGVRAGDIMYQDVNNDGKIDANDRQNCGKVTPDFYGGFNTKLSYKGFDLSVFCQYSVGGKIFSSWRGGGKEGNENTGSYFSTNSTTGIMEIWNLSEYAATHYWHGAGTDNFMPRRVWSGTTGYPSTWDNSFGYTYNTMPSTHYLEDASYMKIKTVTLAYNLPASLVQKIKLNAVKVFVSADNLLTLTKYMGYDPEASWATSPGDAHYGEDFGMQPPLRVFSIGASIKM
jgi:TonB-linked SusC/RagA family outer membrane protein